MKRVLTVQIEVEFSDTSMNVFESSVLPSIRHAARELEKSLNYQYAMDSVTVDYDLGYRRHRRTFQTRKAR